jgi:predicted ribosome quality control (RQC) complex YloA/Tae2 family protein
MAGDFPWQQRSLLETWLADWRQRVGGSEVLRVAAGPGWISLALAGPPRSFLFAVARPGAALLWETSELPPEAIRAALGWTKKPRLAQLLAGHRLLAAGLLPDDLIVALQLRPAATAQHRVLLHQLFGHRGNLVLLDHKGRLLWSMHRRPHAALLQPIPPATFELAPPRSEPAAAAGELIRQRALAHLEDHLEGDLRAKLQRRCRQAIRASERLVGNLAGDLSQAGRGDQHRCIAEALAVHLPAVPRGASQIDLPDPASGRILQISLNPAFSPTENMEHYFRLARKADRGRAIIADRLARARSWQQRLSTRQAQLQAISEKPTERLEALLAWQRDNTECLGETFRPMVAGEHAKTGTEPVRPFRRYRIEGRWEVWIGRSNKENDTLTHQAAAPSDIWLHAQGVTGSHVILRTGGRPELVPRRVLEKAAALAALHSKGRHSSLVPVVYTQRKYVRKPRKSAPGMAAFMREKTLFAVPHVPEKVEPT